MSRIVKKRKTGRVAYALGPVFGLRGPARTVVSFLSFSEAGKLRFLSKLFSDEIKRRWSPDRIKTEVQRMVNYEKAALEAILKDPPSFPGFEFSLNEPTIKHSEPDHDRKQFLLFKSVGFQMCSLSRLRNGLFPGVQARP